MGPSLLQLVAVQKTILPGFLDPKLMLFLLVAMLVILQCFDGAY